MLIDNTKIYGCPNCRSTYSIPSLVSGNTFSARYWSDGKMEAPMMPYESSMIFCKDCQFLFFISEQLLVKQVKNEFFSADHALGLGEGGPGIRDLMELDIPMASYTDQEQVELLFHVWWLFNDRHRLGQQMIRNNEERSFHDHSLVQLIKHIDQQEDALEERLFLLAELYRHLGKFNTSMNVLHAFEDRNDPLKHEMLRHNLMKDTMVFEITKLNK